MRCRKETDYRTVALWLFFTVPFRDKLRLEGGSATPKQVVSSLLRVLFPPLYHGAGHEDHGAGRRQNGGGRAVHDNDGQAVLPALPARAAVLMSGEKLFLSLVPAEDVVDAQVQTGVTG